MREPPKIPKDPKILKKDTKYDTMMSDKNKGGEHDETVCRI
jgi:hypothetical protein